MQSKVAVVFGGTGFIGRLIVGRLVRAGYTVRVPTRRLAKGEPLQVMGPVGPVVPMVCDPKNAAQVGPMVAGAHVVVNAIGTLAETRTATFDDIHGDIPGIIARAAVAAGVKNFIHLSAIGADANSDSAYARSKARGEGAVRAIYPNVIILRPSLVFGAGDRFFNRFARMALTAPLIPLIGGGRTKFQPVAASDVAGAVVAAIDNPEASGKLFELGGPAVYTFRQLMDILLATINRRRLLLPLPWGLAKVLAVFAQHLPGPPLTPDQVALLRHDNVVNSRARTLADLEVNATALEAGLPTYLDVYRKH